jgi:serine/threonine protein kinase
MRDDEFISLQEALAGEYSLERELGRGGMGIVYLARGVQLDRLVAIKLLPSALGQRPQVRERFLREARMAASLSHPCGARGGSSRSLASSWWRGRPSSDHDRSRGRARARRAARSTQSGESCCRGVDSARPATAHANLTPLARCAGARLTIDPAAAPGGVNPTR